MALRSLTIRVFGREVHYDEANNLLNNDITISEDLLGKGVFGEVRKAILPGESNIVAKMIQKRDLDMIQTEAEVCLKLRHPNIVACFGVAQTDRYAVLFFHHINGRTLSRWAQDIQTQHQRSLREDDIRPIMWQVLHALHYLQTACIVHADLHADNVMVAANGTAMLIDFGWAQNFRWGKPGMLRPSNYAYPPEMVIRELGVDHKCDIFFCASMFYSIMFGQGPFGIVAGVEVGVQLAIVQAGMCLIPWIGSSQYSHELLNLFNTCLAFNASDRPCAAEALTFPWFAVGNLTQPQLQEHKRSTPPSHPSQLDRAITEDMSRQWRVPQSDVIKRILSDKNGPMSIGYQAALFAAGKFFHAQPTPHK
ncbi:sperm motility kinase 1-like [Sycon ciliatum]|uniref:sperm motility kinase 1-like n=1 Tax=Sycon ciliatum TaxID=27933 RepID=UPI0031F66960